MTPLELCVTIAAVLGFWAVATAIIIKTCGSKKRKPTPEESDILAQVKVAREQRRAWRAARLARESQAERERSLF